jgi:hypothetical protein
LPEEFHCKRVTALGTTYPTQKSLHFLVRSLLAASKKVSVSLRFEVQGGSARGIDPGDGYQSL